MDTDEKKPEESAAAESEAPKVDESGQDAPADALSRTPDELEEEATQKAAASDTLSKDPAEKKISPIKKFFRKVNLYLLIFVLVLTVAGVVTLVNYLNSQKPAVTPDVASQTLTQDALKQLANSNTTVGNTSQTLTISGNAIIAGQTLMRGNLNVAGNLQTGGSITGSKLTISGDSNLGATQINSLQVATNTAIQGTTTMRDLNVAGTSTFSGAMTASQITVSKLIMSGNAVLQVPNHIAFTGPSPGRSIGSSALLGAGGSVSVNGSDTTGTININTGNSPSGSGCFARVNFHQAFVTNPHVIVSPVGNTAGKLLYYVDRDKSGFSLCTNNAPDANRAFAFDYFVTG